MRQKMLFTAQVFSVVIMFFSIFIVSLKRDKNKEAEARMESVRAAMDTPETPASKSSFFAPITNLWPTISAWY